MVIKATYRGKFDFLQLYFGLDFIGNEPDVKIDTRRDRITLSDPNDASNSIVLNTNKLKAANGEITGGTITDIHFKVDGTEALTLTGLHGKASHLQPAFADQISGIYTFLNELLAGKMTAKGDKFDNLFEVGKGGAATINAGAGDDRLFVWHNKGVTYNGGDGTDYLVFDHQVGSTPPPAQGAVLDLMTGSGTNPFGGALHIKNVENVSGNLGDDTLLGDNKANVLYGGLGGNDVIRGRGGNDTVSISAGFDSPSTTTADGGEGNDTFICDVSSASGMNKLDLNDAGNNTGTFSGDTVIAFEAYVFNDFTFDDTAAAIQIVGTDSSESFTTAKGDDIIEAGGGDDVMRGGAGANQFIFAAAFGDDTISDFSASTTNLIQFDDDLFADFDAMKMHAAQDGFDVVIDAGADGSVRLRNVDLDDLNAGDFSFV